MPHVQSGCQPPGGLAVDGENPKRFADPDRDTKMARSLGIQSEEVLCVANATFVLGLLDEDHICLLVPKLGLKQDMFAAKPLCVECDCPEAEVAALFPFCTQGSGRQAAAQGGRRRQSSSTPKQNHIE